MNKDIIFFGYGENMNEYELSLPIVEAIFLLLMYTI